MLTIFDLVKSDEIGSYWTALTQDEAPHIGEELFPAMKKRGLNLQWIKGAKGLPIALKASAYDAKAIPRPRIGFDRLSAEMPYFKESMYIDEELRQELNIVLETGNQAYIDSVVNRVFDDEAHLLRGAAATRERMRMMALTTGTVSLVSNGQAYNYDYGVPSDHKGTVEASWSDPDTSTPIEDIRKAIEKVQDDTGATLTRAITNGATWRNLRNNQTIRKTIYALTNGAGVVSDNQLRNYLLDELGLEVVINDKRFVDENGNTIKYVPENTFVMFPAGTLGNTWYGTTPAESDLMSSQVANVTVVDTGVAVLTAQKVDPVNVETIVSMIALPSFEAADQIYILDTEA